MAMFEHRLGAQNGLSARLVSRPGRTEQLAEVLVFLFLTVPSMALSFYLVYSPLPHAGFALTAVMIMLRDLGLVALISYFLWRNGEPMSRIGWRWDNAVREVLLGVVLFAPFFCFNLWIATLFRHLGLSQAPPGSEAFLEPHGPGQLALAVVLVAVVAVTEETIFRGYLLLRLSAVSRSVVFAVVISSLVFSIGHGYEGAAGVATVSLMGVIFALIYVWRGSLGAPMTMHFLQDFVVIVVFSALAAGPAKTSSADGPDKAASIRGPTPIAGGCRFAERDAGTLLLGAGLAIRSRTPTENISTLRLPGDPPQQAENPYVIRDRIAARALHFCVLQAGYRLHPSRRTADVRALRSTRTGRLQVIAVKEQNDE